MSRWLPRGRVSVDNDQDMVAWLYQPVGHWNCVREQRRSVTTYCERDWYRFWGHVRAPAVPNRGRTLGMSVELSRYTGFAAARWRADSYSTMDAAVAAFSELAVPDMGIR